MTKPNLREINFEGQKLYTCPNGCHEAELELGSEHQSFMAIIGKPYKYIRCGKCGFGDHKDERQVELEIIDVIKVWNHKCSVYLQSSSVTRKSFPD